MARFRCYQGGVHRTFVIELLARTLIKQARKIVEGTEKAGVSVLGTVIKEPRDYNWPWSWHLDPQSIVL